MALSREQFLELYHQGLSPEQIAKFEAGEVPEGSVAVRAHARRKGTRREILQPLNAVPGFGGVPVGAVTNPDALGAIGGFLGGGAGPGSTAGAVAGGIVGDLLQQDQESMLGLPQESPPMRRALQAGATQGAYNVAGPLIAAPLRLGGKLGMNLALKFTPEAAQTALKEGITATGRGLTKLLGRIRQTSKAEYEIVKHSAGQGIGWRDPAILGREVFQEVASKLEGAPGKELSKLSRLKERWEIDNPTDINPVTLLAKRKYYDKVSSAAQSALKKGAKASESVEDMWNRAMANKMRRVLQEDIPHIVDPQAYLLKTGKATIPSELQALREVVQPTVSPAGGNAAVRVAKRFAAPAATFGVVSGGQMLRGKDARSAAFEGALAAAALDPAVASTIGLHANNPYIPFLIQQGLRALGSGVQSASE